MSLGAAAFLTAAAKPSPEHSYSSAQGRTNLLYNGAMGLGGQLGDCHSSHRAATARGLRGEPGAAPGAGPKGAQGGWRRAQSKIPLVPIPAASHLRHSAKTPSPQGHPAGGGPQGAAAPAHKPRDLSLPDTPGEGCEQQTPAELPSPSPQHLCKLRAPFGPASQAHRAPGRPTRHRLHLGARSVPAPV